MNKRPRTDEEWQELIADEVVKQILETPDKDVLARKWPPLVRHVLDDDDEE